MIKRVSTLLLIFLLPLFAKQYNANILEIEAKLFPKMMLLEKHIQNDKSSKLNIFIISRTIDNCTAKKLQLKIEKNYPNPLLGKLITVEVIAFEDIKKSPDAVIVFHHSAELFEKIASWANKNKILTLAYDPAYLDYDFLASIYIGKSTKPYLNKKVIKEHGFIFDSYLLQLSKFKH